MPRRPAASCAASSATTRPALAARGDHGRGRRAVHGGVQQPGDLRPVDRAQHVREHPSRAGDGWTVSDDGLTVRFDLRQGVKWHDGKPFTAADVRCTFDMLMEKGEAKFRRNPRGVWYENVEKVTADNDFQVTFHLKAAAAVAAGVPRGGLDGDLSLPCAAGADAAPSDRHRSVQVRRVQEQRAGEAGEERRLLEARPALSRRHRVLDHRQPGDAHAGLHRRPCRHDVPDRRHRAAAQGPEEVGAGGAMHAAAAGRELQPDHQPRYAALQRRAGPHRAGPDARPQVVHRHHQRRPGPHRRRDAAAAGRRLGRRSRGAEGPAGLWRRPRGGAREGTGTDARGRLRPGQAPEDEGQHAQRRVLPRLRRDPDRPA